VLCFYFNDTFVIFFIISCNNLIICIATCNYVVGKIGVGDGAGVFAPNYTPPQKKKFGWSCRGFWASMDYPFDVLRYIWYTIVAFWYTSDMISVYYTGHNS